MRLSKYISTKKGFTLIELLIVIAIIGVLSSILLSSFIGVRERARDGKRKSDLSQLQAALEQYRADQAQYPASSSTGAIVTTVNVNCGGTIAAGSSTFMQKLPCDPLGTSSTTYNNGMYWYWSDTSTYYIFACLENANDSQGVNSTDNRFTTANAPKNCTSGNYYIVQNP